MQIATSHIRACKREAEWLRDTYDDASAYQRAADMDMRVRRLQEEVSSISSKVRHVRRSIRLGEATEEEKAEAAALVVQKLRRETKIRRLKRRRDYWDRICERLSRLRLEDPEKIEREWRAWDEDVERLRRWIERRESKTQPPDK